MSNASQSGDEFLTHTCIQVNEPQWDDLAGVGAHAGTSMSSSFVPDKTPFASSSHFISNQAAAAYYDPAFPKKVGLSAETVGSSAAEAACPQEDVSRASLRISKADFEKMGFVEGRCTIENRVGLYGKNL